LSYASLPWRSLRDSSADVASECVREGLKLHMEVLGFEEPVFSPIAALEGDPIHRAFGECELFGSVTGETDASDHGMLEAGADGRPGFVKIAAGKIPFKGSRADDNSVQLDRGARRIACDLYFFGKGARETDEEQKGGEKR
jgi:hypothetical protein